MHPDLVDTHPWRWSSTRFQQYTEFPWTPGGALDALHDSAE
ncbi:hypothetical protein [Embleya sp. NPDC005575]